MGGYTGKMLHIDLGTGETSIEGTDLDDARAFIGAKGLGAKLLFDRLQPGTDPLSPGNLLMFTTGPLTGTQAQTSGRGTVVTKSPQTGLFLDSHFGGTFAAEMKKAGWDVVIITGRSETPVHIHISDDSVEFRDASPLWGKECLQTHDALQEEEGRVRTAVIGPSGENVVRFSAITVDGHRHAGRGGAGAVMGSKNLKAVSIVGTGTVQLHDPDGFSKKAGAVLKGIKKNPFIPNRTKFGTPFWVKPVNDWGLLPTRNYQEGWFEGGETITAEAMQERIVDKGGACYNCVIACWNRSSIKSGPHEGVSLVGPEYETIALMGSNLGIDSIEDVAYLNERCNELGMDTISLGGVLGFAVEAYEKGVLTDADLGGNSISWGDTEALARLADDIAHRRNRAGDILAEGVRIAAERLGKGSDAFSVHAKGLEIPGYDPRGAFGMGLAYATSDRGGCHERAWTVTTEIGDPDYDRFSFERKAELVKGMQDERAAFFSLVLCDFAPVSEEDCVDMLNLATGFDHTVKSYLQAGDRIWNLVRLFNLREGMEPDDSLPPRFFNDPFTKGQAEGVLLDPGNFEGCLKEYYSLRGWTADGVPTAEKAAELGLSGYMPAGTADNEGGD